MYFRIEDSEKGVTGWFPYAGEHRATQLAHRALILPASC